MVIQIPAEYKSEFILDMLEIYTEDEYQSVSKEDEYWMKVTLYFFGGLPILDTEFKHFLKVHTTNQ